jgi:peptide deformylase
MRQLISVNVATLRQRAAELTQVARDRDLTLDELRAIVRNQAGLLACQADLAERVAAFEVRNV